MVFTFTGVARIYRRIVKSKRVKINARVYETPAYWESILTAFGLTMERGTSHKLSYMDDDGMQVAENKLHSSGRVLPKTTDS